MKAELTQKPTRRLIIVIPTLNAATVLPGCLKALASGLENRLIARVIVSDGGSTDDTAAIARDAGCMILTGPAGRGGQLKRGAEAAISDGDDWLLFLHADSWLTPGWEGEVAAHMHTTRPAVCRLRFRAPGPGAAFVAGWANLRSRLFRLPYGDQGLLVLQSQYKAAGGFDDIALMEDVALVRRLPAVQLLQSHAETSAGRYQREGWFWRGTKNLFLLTRYFLGANPEVLAGKYTKQR